MFTYGLLQMDTAKTYIHQLCADTRCHLEDVPKFDGNRESRELVLSTHFDGNDDDDDDELFSSQIDWF